MEHTLNTVIIPLLITVSLIFIVVSISILKFRLPSRFIYKDLHPYFTIAEIRRALNSYISTKAQNIKPDAEADYTFAEKIKLIPSFLRVFNDNAADSRFFFIMGDAGSGKTTFLINLYEKYKSKTYFGGKYKIVLLPLGYISVLDEIELIDDKKETILLLDGFDEDINAVYNYQERLDEIIKAVFQFRFVLITARTQFFLSENYEPRRTGLFSFGESGEIFFSKLYISYFDDADVKNYLWKKYNPTNPFKLRKYLKAIYLVKKLPKLFTKPIFLSNVNSLIEVEDMLNYNYKYIEFMINKTIERSLNKYAVVKSGYTTDLKTWFLNFSEELAIYLYLNNKIHKNGYRINLDELLLLVGNGDDRDTLQEITISYPLLDRNPIGQYKFADQVFFEYFLAKSYIKSNVDIDLNNFENTYLLKFISEMRENLRIDRE